MLDYCKTCPLIKSKTVDEVFDILSENIQVSHPELPHLNILFAEDINPEEVEGFYEFVHNNPEMKSRFSTVSFVPIPQCLQTMGGKAIAHCIHNGIIGDIMSNSINILAGSKPTKVLKLLTKMYGLPPLKNVSTPFRMYAGTFIPDYYTKLDKSGAITKRVTKKHKKIKKLETEIKSLISEDDDPYQIQLKEAELKRIINQEIIRQKDLQLKEIELKPVVFITLPTLYRLFQEIGVDVSSELEQKVFALIRGGGKALAEINTNEIYMEEIQTTHAPLKTYFLDPISIAKRLKYLYTHKDIPFAIDTETLERPGHLGLNWHLETSDLASISISYRDKEGELQAFSFPWGINIDGWKFTDKVRKGLGKRLKKLLLSRSENDAPIIGHKVKYDLKWLMTTLGISIGEIIKSEANFIDTKLASKVVNDNLTTNETSLENLAVKYLNFPDWKGSVEEWNSVMESRPTDIQKQRANENLLEYSSVDAEATYLLYEHFVSLNEKDPSILKVLDTLPLLIRNVLVIEYEGISLDPQKVDQLGKFLKQKYHDHLDRCFEIIEQQSGGEKTFDNFNINSTSQVISFLLNDLKVKLSETTDNDNYKLNDEVRKALLKSDAVPEAAKEFLHNYNEYKSYNLALSGFLRDYKKRAVNNKVYPEIKIIGTITGRTSASHPNIQQIANIHDMKTIFVPKAKDRYIVYSDYSQAEVRMLALLSQDKGLLSTFSSGEDPYLGLAAKIYDISIDEARAKHGLRDQMKSLLLGMNYGMTKYGVSRRLGITKEEAQKLLDDFFHTFSDIKSYQDGLEQFCLKNCYVEGATYKRRRFPILELYSDYSKRHSAIKYKYQRQVINSPIQSTTSDFALRNFCAISDYCISHDIDAQLVGVIHDAGLSDVHKNAVVQVVKLMQVALPRLHPYIIEYMDYKFGKDNYIVPDFPSDIKVGKNWEERSESNPTGLRQVKVKNNKLIFKK